MLQSRMTPPALPVQDELPVQPEIPVVNPKRKYTKKSKSKDTVVLLHCGCLSLNPFIEFRIWNNSSSSDVLNIQASISISPKYESKSKTTSHCHLLLHDCTNVAV